MGLEAAIRAIALAAPGVAAKVGDRCRPLAVAPTDRRPYLTYQVTGRETFDTLADGPADYRRADFELGVYADTYADAVAVSDGLRDHLAGLGTTTAGVELDVWFTEETDVEEVTPEGLGKPIYLRVQTYRALYRTA